MAPNITMLDIEDLKKTKLKPYIEQSIEHKAPDPGALAMLGHNVDLAIANYLAWAVSFNSGSLSHKIKETIRVSLSRQAHCSY